MSSGASLDYLAEFVDIAPAGRAASKNVRILPDWSQRGATCGMLDVDRVVPGGGLVAERAAP